MSTTAPSTPPEVTEDTDAGLRLRPSLRTPILLALASALIVVFAVVADGDTTFQFVRGEVWFQVPSVTVPATALALVLAVLALGLTALAFQRVLVRRTRVPLWVSALVGLLFVVGFLTLAGAGSRSSIAVTSLLTTTMLLSVPLIFGAMSGVICERSGIINIAIEGQLLFGAFAAAVVASFAANAYVGVAAAPVAGALVGALLAWFAVRYQVNQIIVGVVLNTLILGLTSFFAGTLLQTNRELNQPFGLGTVPIPVLSEIPVLGPVLFNQSPLVYAMYVVVIVLNIMLFRSRWGLRTRAVGEHPRAADTVGIKVNKRRVWNTILGGAVAGLGGAYFTVGSNLAFGENMSSGLGYIALAAMILGRWNPIGALCAALLFGFTRSLGNQLSILGSPVPPELIGALPYLVTIVAVAGLIGRVRPPAAEGVPYTK